MAKKKKKAAGEGSLWEQKNGRWRATVYVAGERVSKVHDTQAEAVAWKVATAAARDAGTLASPAAGTLNDWFDRWLAQKAGATEAATAAWYAKQAARGIRPHIGAVKLSALTPAKVADWYAALTKAGKSPAAQRRAGRCLRIALADAVRQQVIAVNPAKAVKLPRHKPAEAVALDLDQARRLLAASDPHPKGVMARLGLDAGLRPQELFAVRRCDLSADCSVLTVRRAVEWVQGRPPREKEPKTAKGKRRVLLAPATAAALRALPARPPGDLMFPGKTGRWLNLRAFNEGPMAAWCKAAGVPYAPVKVLRHTSATLLLQAGANLKAVSERMGHEDPAMTLRIYQHCLPDMQEPVRELAGKLFG